MGCGPSRATEASAYGVDATGCVLDEPSAGRQTRARALAARTRVRTRRRQLLRVRRDGPSAPPRRRRGAVARRGRSVSPRRSVAERAPMARLARRDASAGVRGVAASPRPPSLPSPPKATTERWRFSRNETSRAQSFAVGVRRRLRPRRRSLRLCERAFLVIAIEPNTVTVSDVSNADTNADTDDDASVPRGARGCRGGGARSRGRRGRRGGSAKNKNTKKKSSRRAAASGEDFDESAIRFSPFGDGRTPRTSVQDERRRATPRAARRRRRWRRPRWTQRFERTSGARERRPSSLRFYCGKTSFR